MQFRDLKKQYQVLKKDIDAAMMDVAASSAFIMGKPVKELEAQLADYVGVKHCISCGNGTDALTLALKVWGIGPGDCVFVPDFTFFASAEVVSFEGATPIFVDVDKATFNIDHADLEKKIKMAIAEGKYTPKVIITVDLFGLPSNYPYIREIADKYKLFILEDGAQGFGGRIDSAADRYEVVTDSCNCDKTAGCAKSVEAGQCDKSAEVSQCSKSVGAGQCDKSAEVGQCSKSVEAGLCDMAVGASARRACSFGDISTTSFFPAKPLGCYGDGGAVFTNNDEWAALADSYRVHGKGSFKYDNVRIGMNSRLDTIQAAILQVKFKAFRDYELDDINKAAAKYTSLLKGKVVTPFIPKGFLSSWAQYTIILKNRDERDRVQAQLKEHGIPTMVYYPTPMSAQTAYKNLGCGIVEGAPEDCPNARDLCGRVLSLPIHPYITTEDIVLVVNELLMALGK